MGNKAVDDDLLNHYHNHITALAACALPKVASTVAHSGSLLPPAVTLHGCLADMPLVHPVCLDTLDIFKNFYLSIHQESLRIERY